MDNLTLREFNDALSSSAPTPGGGGVAALAAALGAGLGGMVGSLTVGKKKYAAFDAELTALMAEAKELQDRFLALIGKDAEEFQKLMAVYSLPKDAPGRDADIEAALAAAAEAPLEIVRLCVKEAELTARFREIGSALMLSDAGCAAAMCAAAIRSAALNVYANTKFMRDRSAAEEMNREVRDALEKALPLTDEVYGFVAKTLNMSE